MLAVKGPGHELQRAFDPGEMHETACGICGLDFRCESLIAFVLLPRRWVVERSFAWTSRFRRLVKDYERLPEIVAGLHFVAFACLLLNRAVLTLGAGP